MVPEDGDYESPGYSRDYVQEITGGDRFGGGPQWGATTDFQPAEKDLVVFAVGVSVRYHQHLFLRHLLSFSQEGTQCGRPEKPTDSGRAGDHPGGRPADFS